MGYGDYAPMADKYLLPDGSITTFDNVEVLPANEARALLYAQRASSVAKWLMPDGSIVSGLPITIQGSDLDSPVNHIDFNLSPTGVPTEIGTLAWSDEDKTLNLQLSSDVHLSIGQEMYVPRCVNKTGSDIANGKVVYISGAQGNRPTISLADANIYEQGERTIGLTTEAITDNHEGFVTAFGLVRDLDTSMYDEGDILYLSETAGEFTDVPPTAPVPKIKIGIVVKSNDVDGWVFVHIDRDKRVFGDYDNGNYGYFDDNGFYKAIGNGIGYKDIDFPIIIRTTGANIPSLTTVQGNITAPQWQVNDLNVCEGQEFIHEWEEGSQVNWHIHMLTNGLDITDRYVKWEVEWFWVKPNEAISTSQTASYEFKIPANTADKTMFIVPIYQWTPTNGKIGGHCYARLRRIASTGLAPTNDPWCTMLQLHIKCNTPNGSRSITTK